MFHFGDWRGNLLAQGTNVYTWDAANRLVSAEVDGVVSAFEYNGLGQRMAQTVNGLTTEYVLDVAGGLPEVIVATTGGASTRYVQVQGQILGEYEAGAWGYVLPDALGSVRQLVDAAGQVTLAQSYDPFGVPHSQHGTQNPQLPFGYTGEWWGSYMELLFLRARWYSPETGTFLSRDLVKSEPPYLYVHDNPINHVDPSGLIPPLPPLLPGGDPEEDLWALVEAARSVYSKQGLVVNCRKQKDDGQHPSDTVGDIFVDFVCEY